MGNFEEAFHKQKRILELVSNKEVVNNFEKEFKNARYTEALIAAAETWENYQILISYLPITCTGCMLPLEIKKRHWNG